MILFWLFVMDAVPSGHFFVHYTAGDLSPFLERFLPDTRVQGVQHGPDGTYQLVIDEPAYASVHLPGDFDQLKIDVAFQNTSQPIIEIGVLANDAPRQYELAPLQNLIIDASLWDRLEEDGTVLLQRAKMYSSIDDFLLNLPDRDTIATYHYDLNQPYRIPDYVAANALSTTNVTLRGYHEYVTYIKNEPLMIQADFMNMQREEGEDPVTILVFNETSQLVAEQTVASVEDSAMHAIALVQNNLPEGVYKVILKADRDIFFRQLTTRQRYMSFVGAVYVGDASGYSDAPGAVRFWTDAKHLSFYTYHADAAQQVNIGTGTLKMPEAQVRYDYDVKDPGTVDVFAPAGDFTVTGEGMLAFNPRQWFNPYPTRLDWNTELDTRGINFVIAHYTKPTKQGLWMHASATFDLDSALKTSGDMQLVLSAPGIKSSQASVQLHAINLEFIRPPRPFSELLTSLVQSIKDFSL